MWTATMSHGPMVSMESGLEDRNNEQDGAVYIEGPVSQWSPA